MAMKKGNKVVRLVTPKATGKKKASRSTPPKATHQRDAEAEDNHSLIRERAYLLAERDGFKRDSAAYWLAAEEEVSGSRSD